MTMTITRNATFKTKTSSLGLNKGTNQRPIGILSYNDTTGRIVQCEIFTPFWEGKTPDMVESIKFLFSKGYGMIRPNTIAYSSLV